MNKMFNISEVSKLLDLIDPVTKKPQNHILRYWEKEFSQIKPKIINKRRYYSPKQIEIVKLIKFLLKNEQITIAGVKKLMNLKLNQLDDSNKFSLKEKYYKLILKDKSKSLLEKINRIRNYGKKNSS
tara:strand:- start:499 stop:879 length:381 start_codon:yes stop_codon:yes gene_type:complete